MRRPAPAIATRRELLIATGGFAILTLVLTYPQVRHLSSQVAPHYDALFSVWRLAWIAHQLPRDPLHLFDANIFYPEQGTLAYSDAMLLPGLLAAPLIWLGLHPVLVYNLLVLLSFVACGMAMYILVRAVTGSVPGAWLGGMVFAFQPYRLGHYAHLELLWGCWIPLAFWALHRVLASRRVRDGALVGLFVALQAWSCLYYAVFLVTALAVLTLVMLTGRSRAELAALVKPAIAAVAICAALVGPYAIPYVNTRSTVGMRSGQEIRDWSPTLKSYIATPPQHWLYGRVTGRFASQEGTMFPGLVAIALALVGVFGPFNRRGLAYAVLLLVAFDLSLGFNGLTYRAFYALLWPYQNLRVPGRMFVVVSAALAVLAGEGLGRLLRWIKGPLARRAAGSALIVFVLLESASMPLELTAVPQAPPAVYSWLKTQPPAVIMEWPLPRAWSLGVTQEPLYMYYSTFHWQTLVNGYSGFHPPSYISLVETVWMFPRPEALRYMRLLGIRYVILHSRLSPIPYADLRTQLRDHPDFELIMTGREGAEEVAVYRFHTAPAGSER